jgi:predicted extracellular nuclease
MAMRPVTSTPTDKIAIPEIQGRGALSPFVGKSLQTEGVITAVLDAGKKEGFFLQDIKGDDNAATSDGIFVQASTLFGKNGERLYTPGQVVSVSGRVAENAGLTTLEATTNGIKKVAPTLAMDKLPSPVVLDLPKSMTQAKSYMEAHEGMLGTLNNPLVLHATDRYGRTVVVDEKAHGPQRDFDDSTAGLRVTIDNSLGNKPQLGMGDRLNEVVGPIDYVWDEEYRVLQKTYPEIDRASLPPKRWGDLDGDDRVTDKDLAAIAKRSGEAAYGPLDPADLNADGKVTKTDVTLATKRAAMTTDAPAFRVANMNVENLFDTEKDPNKDNKTLSPNQLSQKLTRISGAIREQLGAPEVITMQEVENANVLDQLVNRPEMKPYNYKYQILPGEDHRGINVAFLYRGDDVKVTNVRQAQKKEQLNDGLTASSGSDDFLFARPPLIADLSIGSGDKKTDLTMIVNHFKSKLSPDGLPTEPRRLEQSKFVGKLVDDLRNAHPEREVIVTGDLNDGEKSKVIRALTGTTKNPRLVSPIVQNVPRGERYTFNYDGLSDSYDHILVTPGLAARTADAAVRHFNNDLPASAEWQSGPYGTADHDSPEVAFRLAVADATKQAAPKATKTTKSSKTAKAPHKRTKA